MLEPLYTADEMRAAEAGQDVDDLMARAGRAVAEEAMRRFPEARRFVAVCGGGANGGDGRIAVDVLRGAGREAEVSDDVSGADVIVDALFGTGFRGEAREDAARKIAAVNAAGAPGGAGRVASGGRGGARGRPRVESPRLGGGRRARRRRRGPDRDDARAEGWARSGA